MLLMGFLVHHVSKAVIGFDFLSTTFMSTSHKGKLTSNKDCNLELLDSSTPSPVSSLSTTAGGGPVGIIGGKTVSLF